MSLHYFNLLYWKINDFLKIPTNISIPSTAFKISWKIPTYLIIPSNSSIRNSRVRLHVQLKHEMAGTKNFFWSYYMIYLISNVFQAFWHIYTGFGPHLTLSLAGWNINVWVKCKNGKMENSNFEFFGWLDFFQISIRWSLLFLKIVREKKIEVYY